MRLRCWVNGEEGRLADDGTGAAAGGAFDRATSRPPPSVAAFLLSEGPVEALSRNCAGLRTTVTVAGSKAEPRSRVRGALIVGAEQSSTTSNMAQPHSRKAVGLVADGREPLILIERNDR